MNWEAVSRTICFSSDSLSFYVLSWLTPTVGLWPAPDPCRKLFRHAPLEVSIETGTIKPSKPNFVKADFELLLSPPFAKFKGRAGWVSKVNSRLPKQGYDASYASLLAWANRLLCYALLACFNECLELITRTLQHASQTFVVIRRND